jgi:hypothetical protein
MSSKSAGVITFHSPFLGFLKLASSTVGSGNPSKESKAHTLRWRFSFKLKKANEEKGLAEANAAFDNIALNLGYHANLLAK